MSIRSMTLTIVVALMLMGTTAQPAAAHPAYTAQGYGTSYLKATAQFADGYIQACDHAADGRPLVANAFVKKDGSWARIGRVQDSYGGDCNGDFLLRDADAHNACVRFDSGAVGLCGSKSLAEH